MYLVVRVFCIDDRIYNTLIQLVTTLRLPPKETPSILIQPALDPRYIA
jgi:hypothetical protein